MLRTRPYGGESAPMVVPHVVIAAAEHAVVGCMQSGGLPAVKRVAVASLALLAGFMVVRAAQAAPPVVVELFTSQACSSCPPADAFLARLVARRPDVLALDMHVTYWDRLGWRDRFSLPAVTARQEWYAKLMNRRNVFTPQIVIGGVRQAIGSDRAAVRAAIARVKALAPPSVPIRLAATAGGGLEIKADPGHGTGTLWLIGFDPHHVTPIGGGENAGRTLNEANVVRSLKAVGNWRGQAMQVGVSRPAGQRTAVLLQAPDGRILGAGVLPPG